MKTTWRKEIEPYRDYIVFSTLTNEEWDVEFDSGYGGTEGKPFLAWSNNYVYFPVCYDGSEWIERVPRGPWGLNAVIESKLKHFGGG